MRKKLKELLTPSVLGNALSLILAISFFLIVNNLDVVSSTTSAIISVIMPFIIAFSLAYILNTPIVWFENNVFYKLNKKLSKTFSIFIIYLLFLFFTSALIFAIVPQMVQTISVISSSLPSTRTNLG